MADIKDFFIVRRDDTYPQADDSAADMHNAAQHAVGMSNSRRGDAALELEPTY